MNTDILKVMAISLAKKINSIINIPWVSEEQEQDFFELIVLLVLETLLTQLSVDLKKK